MIEIRGRTTTDLSVGILVILESLAGREKLTLMKYRVPHPHTVPVCRPRVDDACSAVRAVCAVRRDARDACVAMGWLVYVQEGSGSPSPLLGRPRVSALTQRPINRITIPKDSRLVPLSRIINADRVGR